jgi:hypothetical protein
MRTNKGRLIESVNLLAEKRYLDGKFNPKEKKEKPKFNVMPVGGDGPVKKWKISLFIEKPTGGLKDVMDIEMIEKLNLKRTYVSKESALEDLEKINMSDIENMDDVV